MEKSKTRFLSVLAAIILILSSLGVSAFAADTKTVREGNAKWLKSNISLDSEYSGTIDWANFALATGDFGPNKKYLSFIENKVKTDFSSFYLSDYSRIALAVNAVGGDATDVGGKNLIKAIKAYDFSKETSISVVAYTILALESKDYDAEETVDTLISLLLADGVQRSDGGFAFEFKVGEYSKSGDIDSTAMVLQAFADHRDKSEVSASVKKALAFLKSSQLSSGGFGLYGESAESTAQVLTALCMLDINPLSADYKKGNNNILTSLYSFVGEDGGMRSYDGSLNAITTYQALNALNEYDRYIEKEKDIFDFTKDKVTTTESSKAADKTESGTWKTIKIALIAVLAILCIGEIIFLVMKKKKSGNS